MLTKFPDGLVACVSDSYNIWDACEKLWGGKLKGLVEDRGKRGGTLVVRPDSGDPATVVVKVCGRKPVNSIITMEATVICGTVEDLNLRTSCSAEDTFLQDFLIILKRMFQNYKNIFCQSISLLLVVQY